VDLEYYPFNWQLLASITVDCHRRDVTIMPNGQRLSKTHLVIVSPINGQRRFRTVPHDAGQIHRAFLVYVHLWLSDDHGHGLCERNNVRAYKFRSLCAFIRKIPFNISRGDHQYRFITASPISIQNFTFVSALRWKFNQLVNLHLAFNPDISRDNGTLFPDII
jgi:hypothetical protein